MVARERRSIVLLSGGMDSAACVKFYLNLGHTVQGIHVDYGQAAAAKEFRSASDLASHYGIHLATLACDFGHKFREGEIRGRNALLVLAALMSHSDFNGLIGLGVHSGTTYYDCSDVFISDLNRIVVGYSGGVVSLDTPFLKWTKRMIYEYCREQEVPLHLTYSCEAGTDVPCGKCKSCLDRSVLDAC
jgi:7-cyano-7-deazaguanine synthase